MVGRIVFSRLWQAAVAYVMAVLLLTIYGAEVCPFLEQLTYWQMLGILAGAYAIAFAIRVPVFFGLEVHARRLGADHLYRLPWRLLWADLAIWAFAGLLVTAWNALHYDFPVPSGLKIVLGSLTLGIFSSGYHALAVEADLLSAADSLPVALGSRFFSISSKFMAFFSASVVVVSGVILLLVYKDFTFTIESLTTGAPFSFSWIIKEVLFVFAVLVAGALLVANRYGRNLRLMFEVQLETFGAVERGDLERSVPVTTNDEFGLIAQATNEMIAGLRDKERIKRAFGKYLSPSVAKAVLETEQETGLSGRLVTAAVLFTDLRGFTPLSEKCSPQEMVALLNEYFTMVVRAVHDNNGVLDKFVGDAAMAVFGLDDQPGPCENALRTAFSIRSGLVELNAGLSARNLPALENGIGIHLGPVVAGNIGSEERLEYTVIGDAVNVASRLESLTKEISTPLAISHEVYASLNTESQGGLTDLGAWQLKGKSQPTTVYGISAVPPSPGQPGGGETGKAGSR
jgi:adenylate cyclase